MALAERLSLVTDALASLDHCDLEMWRLPKFDVRSPGDCLSGPEREFRYLSSASSAGAPMSADTHLSRAHQYPYPSQQICSLDTTSGLQVGCGNYTSTLFVLYKSSCRDSTPGHLTSHQHLQRSINAIITAYPGACCELHFTLPSADT